MTLVSIVTPAYNAAVFIEEAVRSVHAQTYRPLEHLVVDDASTDATAAIVTRLAVELSGPDYRLRMLQHPENRGAAAALVNGVTAADGDAVCWLSADDAYVEPSKTASQVALLRSSDVVFDTRFLTGPAPAEGRLIRARWPLAMHASARLRSYQPDPLLVGLLFANPINGSSILLRRHVFDDVAGFDLALGNIDADADLWLRLSALGVRMTPRAATGIFYRLHAGQTSNRLDEMAEGTTLSRLRVIQALADRQRLLPLLDRNRGALRLAVLSRQHRAWPVVTAALTRLMAEGGKGSELWVRAANRDLAWRRLVDRAEADRLWARARELQHSEEFLRFLRGLDGG